MSDQLDSPDEWDAVPTGTSLEERAAALRAAWVRAVRRHHTKASGQPSRYNSNVTWDGGLDRATNRVYKPVWPGLVEKADALGLDVFELLRMLFATLMTEQAPVPRMIVAPENVTRTKANGPEQEAAIRMAASTEAVVFRSALGSVRRSTEDPDPRAAVRYVLNDLGRNLSPLFRFSVAAATGNYDIADRWRELALRQFSVRPSAYIANWAHLLPPEVVSAFKTKVAKEAR